jgi:hypothetical protein
MCPLIYGVEGGWRNRNSIGRGSTSGSSRLKPQSLSGGASGATQHRRPPAPPREVGYIGYIGNMPGQTGFDSVNAQVTAVTSRQTCQTQGWYEFACAFVDMKWARAAATTRRTHAEAMTTLTVAMLSDRRGKPDDKLLRSALSRWGFNTARRGGASGEVRDALNWVHAHTLRVSSLRDPGTLRRVLDSLAVRLDGQAAAPNVTRRKRSVLSTSIGYAVELGLLDENPIPALKWTPPKVATTVDRRRVASPLQARSLLNAVCSQQRTRHTARGILRLPIFRCASPRGSRRLAQAQPVTTRIRVGPTADRKGRAARGQ